MHSHISIKIMLQYNTYALIIPIILPLLTKNKAQQYLQLEEQDSESTHNGSNTGRDERRGSA